LKRFAADSVAGLTNAVAAYLDCAAEARRLAAFPVQGLVNPVAVPMMQATLEEFARLMECKAYNLEAKIAELAPVGGEA
jgi:hypothetical protein